MEIARELELLRKIEALVIERDRLRALNTEMYNALDLMTRWTPSGFAPQSKADAMEKAEMAMEKYLAHE